MFSKKPYGKGMASFMAGCVVALGAAAAAIFMLNNNNARDMKQPELVQSPQSSAPVEMLIPTRAASLVEMQSELPVAASVAVHSTHATVASKSETMPELEMASAAIIAEKPKKNRQNVKPITQAEMATNNSEIELTQDDPVLGTVTPLPTRKANKPRKAVAENNLRQVDTEVHPTAQQILDSGSIEKAREVAKKEAHTVKKVESKSADDVNKNTQNNHVSGSKTVQAGAYNNRAAAEKQRAELALKGVKTHVVEAQSGGKTVYRVQTETMDSNQAAKVQQKLHQNGIDTITR